MNLTTDCEVDYMEKGASYPLSISPQKASTSVDLAKTVHLQDTFYPRVPVPCEEDCLKRLLQGPLAAHWSKPRNKIAIITLQIK